MSAAATQAQQKPPPKVLRIGVFREGKPAGERLFRAGQVVQGADIERIVVVALGGTVGSVLEGQPLAVRHELFSPRGEGFVLNLPETMDGRLQWKDGIRSVEELGGRNEATRKGDQWQVVLNDQVRGKLVAGNLTILFQFVPAPPESARPINPADFRWRFIDDDDPLFLGLLGVFTMVAAAFMVWVRLTPLPERNDLDAIDAAVDLVVTKEIEQVVLPEKGPQEAVVEEKPEEKPAEETRADKPSEPSAAPTQESVVKKSLLLQLIGTSGDASGDSAVRDLLGDDGAGVQALDAALQGVSGVQQADAQSLGVKQGSGGGREDAKVGVGIATGGSSGTGTGASVTIKKPKIGYENASTDVEEGDGGSIPSIVKKNSGRVQTCVEQALRVNPSLNGRVVVEFSISKGKVTEASIASNTTGDDGLGSCMARAVRGIRFGDDVTARVEFPYVVSGQ